jgi:hypothetical protein
MLEGGGDILINIILSMLIRAKARIKEDEVVTVHMVNT